MRGHANNNLTHGIKCSLFIIVNHVTLPVFKMRGTCLALRCSLSVSSLCFVFSPQSSDGLLTLRDGGPLYLKSDVMIYV